MNFFMVILLAGQYIGAYGPAPGQAYGFETKERCEEVMADQRDVIERAKIKAPELVIECVTEKTFDALVANPYGASLQRY